MDLKQIAVRLRAEREFRGWTCNQVIEELGFPYYLTNRSIWSVENADITDVRPPSLRVVMKLLDAYGLEFTIVRKGDDGQ